MTKRWNIVVGCHKLQTDSRESRSGGGLFATGQQQIKRAESRRLRTLWSAPFVESYTARRRLLEPLSSAVSALDVTG